MDWACPMANGANNRMTIKGMSVHTYFPDFPFLSMNGCVFVTYSWHNFAESGSATKCLLLGLLLVYYCVDQYFFN